MTTSITDRSHLTKLTSFTSGADGRPEPDAAVNVALACQRLGIIIKRLAPGSVCACGPVLPFAGEGQISNRIHDHFGFHPTARAFRTFFQTIEEPAPAWVKRLYLNGALR